MMEGMSSTTPQPTPGETPPSRLGAHTGVFALAAALALTVVMIGLGEWVTRQTAAHAERSAVIYGRVLLGPTLPIAVPGVRQWKGVQATVLITRREDDARLATVRTDKHGRYRIPVPPGEYVVTVRLDDPSIATAVPTVDVELARGERVRVVLRLDTGIRGPDASPSPASGG
jgi:Carboxypeptidase regulatory-like domain